MQYHWVSHFFLLSIYSPSADLSLVSKSIIGKALIADISVSTFVAKLKGLGRIPVLVLLKLPVQHYVLQC